MTRQETAAILLLITRVFPSVKVADGTIEAWHELLNDLAFDLCLAATKKVLGEQEFPTLPPIGLIRKAALFLSSPYSLTSAEAWELVRKNIQRFGYYQETEGKEDLPPTVRRAVEAIGWQEMCTSEQPDIVRGQFRKTYETLAAREQELELMAPEIREMVGPRRRAVEASNG